MPDLQTELNKVMQTWDNGAEAPSESSPLTKRSVKFQPTNNVTRVTFDYVKRNPGQSRRAVVLELERLGYKVSSTTSLLSQMVRQGMLNTVNGGLFVSQPEYTPLRQSLLRNSRTRKKAVKAPAAPRPRVPEGRKAAPGTGASQKYPASWSANQVLEGLSVLQARALYDELHRIFGA